MAARATATPTRVPRSMVSRRSTTRRRGQSSRTVSNSRMPRGLMAVSSSSSSSSCGDDDDDGSSSIIMAVVFSGTANAAAATPGRGPRCCCCCLLASSESFLMVSSRLSSMLATTKVSPPAWWKSPRAMEMSFSAWGGFQTETSKPRAWCERSTCVREARKAGSAALRARAKSTQPPASSLGCGPARVCARIILRGVLASTRKTTSWCKKPMA